MGSAQRIKMVVLKVGSGLDYQDLSRVTSTTHKTSWFSETCEEHTSVKCEDKRIAFPKGDTLPMGCVLHSRCLQSKALC